MSTIGSKKEPRALAFPPRLLRVFDIIVSLRVGIRWHKPVFYHRTQTSMRVPQVSGRMLNHVEPSAHFSGFILDTTLIDYLQIDSCGHFSIVERGMPDPGVIGYIKVVRSICHARPFVGLTVFVPRAVW